MRCVIESDTERHAAIVSTPEQQLPRSRRQGAPVEMRRMLLLSDQIAPR